MRRSRLWILLLVVACGGKDDSSRHTGPAKPPPSSVLPKPVEAKQPVPNRLPPIDHDLAAIVRKGELKVLFTFNSTGYFMYRGDMMGYEYELLNIYAREKKLRLVPVLARDSRTLFEQLDRGEGDVIAAQLVAGRDRTQLAMTSPLYETAPVVVQRTAAGAAAGATSTVKKALAREDRENPSPVEIRARLVSKPDELAGQQVHLAQSSSYYQRLVELNEELTNDVVVVEVEATTDKLIQQLAEGEIAYTVAAENVAALRSGEYSNLLIKPALGPPEPIVWGVRTNSVQLKASLDEWIAAKKKKGLLAVLYRKYFLDRKGYRKRRESRYLTGESGTLSPFDAYFKESARIPGWDWRLVASQAYQESRFETRARSWAGAVGVMQIMPGTARELRVNPANPRESIEGACRYLWKLDRRWKDEITRESERIKFILGAYNVGAGHVEDARRLARKHGDDDDSWTDVAYWLIRKSKRDVYNDPVVKYGFARGTEPVTYVDQILTRYQHYRQFAPADEERPAEKPAEEPTTPPTETDALPEKRGR